MQVAVFIGEAIGHFANDAAMRVTTVRRNKGFLVAQSRLWWVRQCVLLGIWGAALTARWGIRGLTGHVT